MGVRATELMSREQSWCERSNPQPRFSLPIQSNSAFAEFDMFGAEIGRVRFRMEGGVGETGTGLEGANPTLPSPKTGKERKTAASSLTTSGRGYRNRHHHPLRWRCLCSRNTLRSRRVEIWPTADRLHAAILPRHARSRSADCPQDRPSDCPGPIAGAQAA